MAGTGLISVGFIILKDGEPYRPKKNAYSSSTTPRVYSTAGKAAYQATSVKGTVIEVFYQGKLE
jgi:hypothetical protein